MNFDFQQMQTAMAEAKRRYDELRQKMAQATEEATAGAGMVWVKINGEKQVLEVRLDPEVVKNDPDMLPDLIRAAVNEAGRRMDEKLKGEMGAMMGGLLGGMPPGLF
ncbi:MAG TPA: YbaB/EbfC family nucleoid-associated protein [Terriglobales bacterium]|nr:YbaB/EbfC family nucleoid-associated protein [Terriglobales bacterium]